MPKLKDPSAKKALMSVRLGARHVLAIDLLRRLHGYDSDGEVITRAIDNLVGTEEDGGGLFAYVAGESAPTDLLKAVWSNFEWERLLKMRKLRPELLKRDEQIALAIADTCKECWIGTDGTRGKERQPNPLEMVAKWPAIRARARQICLGDAAQSAQGSD